MSVFLKMAGTEFGVLIPTFHFHGELEAFIHGSVSFSSGAYFIWILDMLVRLKNSFSL